MLIALLIFFAAGAGSGWIYANAIGQFQWYSPLLLLGILYFSAMLHMVLHEAGHLLFGLLTGYRFLSFRVGGWMLVKINGKMQIKHYSLAGTGGQCLLLPPEDNGGTMPQALYNMGGVIGNLFTALIACALAFLFQESAAASAFLKCFALIGLTYALLNGIPMTIGEMANDGKNALFLRKNEAAVRAFRIQLLISGQLTNGVRLKDMKEEWFTLPKEEDMANSLCAAIAVFAENRLMDEQNFKEAAQLTDALLAMPSGILGIHRMLLKNDRLFCELIGENDGATVQRLLTKKQKQQMKKMQNHPSLLRTQYALALKREKDREKAEKILRQFEKMAGKYPYKPDIVSEREIMRQAADSGEPKLPS